MRKEFKYGIGGLIFGFVFCFILWVMALNVSASELDELPEAEKREIVQDEQSEMSESPLMESDQGNVVADQSPQESEIAVAVVQDEQIDLTTMIPADQLEMLDNWARELDAAEDETRIDLYMI